MHELRLEQIYCPYCGQPFEAIIDTSNQDYIEDCAVCCRPITFTLRVDGEDFSLQLNAEDDC